MQRVCVYKNLRNGMWSVTEATASGNRGKLLFHAKRIALTNVQFVVKESRRQAVNAKRCREVHAWAIGDTVESFGIGGDRREVTYNPYRAPTFTLRDGTPVHRADCVVFTDLARIVV